MSNSIGFSKMILTTFFMLSVLVASNCQDITIKHGQTTLEVNLPETKITTYIGDLTFAGANGRVIVKEDVKATITQIGDSYSIKFSDGVPSITGLVFKKDDDEYVSVSTGSSLSGIVFDGDDLDIALIKNGNNWAFSGEK